MSVPFVFANQTGIIPLNELDSNFTFLDNKVPALALAAGVVTQGAQPAITSVGTLGSLSVTGAVSAASVSAGQLFGTLVSASQPNINEIGTLSSLTVSNVITAGSVIASSLSGELTTAAQPSITSVGTLSALTVSGGITGTLTTAAQPNITSLGTLSALTVSGGITGTLTTAAQPNITAVGTLSALTVAGNVSAAGINTGTAVCTTVTATNISGTLTTAAQPNITSVGSLTNLSVVGTVTAAALVGNITTAAQPNITSVGTLSTLQVTGNILAADVTAPDITSFRVVANESVTAGNLVVSGSGTLNGFAIGYRDLPQVQLAVGANPLTANAGGQLWYSTQSSTVAVNIPLQSAIPLPIGTAVTIINRGTASLIVTRATGVDLWLAGNVTSSDRTVASYGMASLIKIGNDQWWINGTGVT